MNFRNSILLTALSLLGFEIIAQNHGNYDSTYAPSKGIYGNAEFDFYYDIDHLIVKNGAFKFKTSNSDTAWTTVNEEQSWEGEYSENKKHGSWNYSTIKHELDITAILDDHLEYDLRTIKTIIKANYKHGIPDGVWISESELVKKNEDPIFYDKVELTLKKGRADGPFKHQYLENNGSIGETKGVFTRGLFEGIWEFKYLKEANQIREKRYYTTGILRAVVKSSNMGEVDSLYFEQSPETQEVLESNVKSHFLNRPFSITYNDGYPMSSAYIQSQNDGNIALKEVHDQLLKFDKIWLKKQKLVYGTNRGKYPLSENEEIYITQWFRIEQDFQFLVEEIKEHEIRDFGESSDSIAKFTIAWIENQEKLFDLLGTLSQVFLSKEIEYYYRDNLILKQAFHLLETDSIHIDNKVKAIHYETSEEDKKNVFTYLLSNYQERIKVGKLLDAELSKNETSSSLEDELERLPKRIAAERAKLDSIYNPDKRDKNVDLLLTHINDNFLEGTIETNYEQFKTTKDLDEKKQLRDSILIDLNGINQIYSLATSISERYTYVDSHYTEYVFDAFTFSDNVPSRIKKKLFDQVQKVQTDLINRAIETDTPQECLKVIQEISNIQVILIYLRDKQTKPLEKSLNRANTLDEKLNLMHEVL